eukprot:4941479-Pyramimonas_sp.AAC.1
MGRKAGGKKRTMTRKMHADPVEYQRHLGRPRCHRRTELAQCHAPQHDPRGNATRHDDERRQHMQ